MSKLYCFFIGVIAQSFCFGQSPESLQKKADSLFQLKDYRDAALAYSGAAKLVPAEQPGVLFRMNLLAARSWALSKVPDSAFAQLEGITNPVYNNVISIATEPDLASLHTDKRWDQLNKKLFETATKESFAPRDATYTQQEIIYGRKDGMALTMLHLRPKQKANDKTVMLIRSGGWGSSFYMAGAQEASMYLNQGYNVFIVFHGSEPVYSVADAIEDIQRAVRFIRYNASSYSISPNKIGIVGYSAAAHLALMSGMADSSFIQYSPDPVDHVSSKVQTVVSFYPVSNFLNWDDEGNNAFSAFLFKQMLTHVLEFRRWNAQRRRFDAVTDSVAISNVLKQVSPFYHVSANDAPTLLFHGDKDELVPWQQSQLLAKKLATAGVPVSFNLKKDGGHGWRKTAEEDKMILDWLEKYLK